MLGVSAGGASAAEAELPGTVDAEAELPAAADAEAELPAAADADGAEGRRAALGSPRPSAKRAGSTKEGEPGSVE